MFGSFRKQKAVFWSDSGISDGFGSPIYETPIEINVRWKKINELFIDEYGKEKTSNAIVYPDREINTNDYLYLGELDDLTTEQKEDPKLLDNVFSVKKIENTVDVNNITSLFKVWL